MTIKFSLTLVSMAMVSNAFSQAVTYPETKKVDSVDTYFGTQVKDPYRWLEDDKSAETADWVKKQNEVTTGYFKNIPFRAKLKERMTALWDFPKYSAPSKKGDFYFYSKNDGIQNQPVIYMSKGPDGRGSVVLDPNKLSADGTVALNDYKVRGDAKFLAYTSSKSGSDWEDIHVIDLDTKKPTSDELKWVKFSSIAWKGDGFFYSRYDEPAKGTELTQKNEFQKIYFHKLGTPQTEDVLTFQDQEHPLRTYTAQVTDDERFLIIYESETTSGNQLYVKDLLEREGKTNEIKQIVTGFDDEFQVIDNMGTSLVVITNKNAPKYKIIVINVVKPDEDKWKTLIPEKEEVLQGAVIAGERLITKYMKDAVSKLYVYSLTGEQDSEIELPGIGTVDEMSGAKGVNDFFYSFTTFTNPTTIYKYDLGNKKKEIQFKFKFDFKQENYETTQVFYEGKDGIKVPMFIVHKKGIEQDGTNPTLLFGYGGFNISKTPEFKVERLAFLEAGGVFAMPCIRGGGEYGEDWHKAGSKLNKQNVFDDFIAAAEYLVAQGYCSNSTLAIEGRSNGGLLVGACMTQRPDLFKVAVPVVGVLDMLRFHKFTIGWSWVGDYGSSDNEQEFPYLLKYSPLHNIKEGVNYPNTLVVTGDHDDRVVPAHSFKYTATLQEKYAKGENVVLIRIDSNGGHGAGKPTTKLIEEQTDIFAFIMFNLGMNPKFK